MKSDVVIGADRLERTHAEVVSTGVYEEIVVPERIVTRSEMVAGTRVRLTQIGLPPMPAAGQIITGGSNDSFDKLEAFLAD